MVGDVIFLCDKHYRELVHLIRFMKSHGASAVASSRLAATHKADVDACPDCTETMPVERTAESQLEKP
jgi:hypothetical protein